MILVFISYCIDVSTQEEDDDGRTDSLYLESCCLYGVNAPKMVQIVNWILYYMAQGCLTAAMSDQQFHLCNE